MKQGKRLINFRVVKRLGCCMLICSLTVSNMFGSWASSISKTEQEKKKAEQSLDAEKQKMNEIEKDKSAANNKLAEMNTDLSEILNVIQVLETDLKMKEEEIVQAEEDYAAAKASEEKQYTSMKKRIKYIYESGNTQYLDVLMQSKSMADMLNKAEYINQLYEYDKRMLDEYTSTKNQVAELKEELAQDKDDLLAIEEEQERQKADLEVMIAKKKTEVSNFDAQLAEAKSNAAAYAKSVEEQTNKLKALKAEEAKKAAEAAKKAEEARKAAEAAAKAKPKTTTGNKTTSTTGPGVASSTGGTAQGRSIANYALQFVGNPYVYGGTSLTNGADCSGFTQSVFRNFGISIPRTSSEQSRVGQAVDFADIQPGDLVFYAGHVAISIGGGQIVHASTAKTGIKVSPVTYRTILGIRRVY